MVPTSAMQQIKALANIVNELQYNEIPEKYWKERIRWLVTHELKELNSHEERMNYIDFVAREITEQYFKENL